MSYGPFKKEDVVMIPTTNAKFLLRDGTVERVILDMEESD
ncbi:MAG: DNA replication complex subunit Gins51 [Candidatus Thorarchaeota archaeon]